MAPKPRACRSTLKLKTPVPTDPAALARRATKSRLQKARQGLESLEARLRALLDDKTGSVRLIYGNTLPLIPNEAEGKLRSIARTKREAEGCELCAAWLEETADLRERIETLRNTPLPEKDPSYTGPLLSLSTINHMGKVRTPSGIRRLPDVTVLLAEREARKVARKARGTTLFEEFQRELEEAAEAKAAGNVPH